MFRKFALFCVFLTLCVMALGTYVRISDAGLGCPDWPGCYGRAIVDAFPKSPSGETTVDTAKAWKEMTHRYLAGSLGACVLALTVAAFRVRERRASAVTWSLLTVLILAIQAALGMGAVRLQVMPPVILAHLVAGLLTLGLLYRLYLSQRPDRDVLPADPADAPGLRWLARAGFLILIIQIVSGGWTSANYAGLACPDFPTCLGSYHPPVDYLTGFTPRLDAGINYQGGILPHAARAAIHWTHRLGALITFVLLSLLGLLLTSNPKVPRLSKPGLLLLFLLSVQVGLGVAAVLWRLPVYIVVAHSVVAAFLALTMLHILFFLRGPGAVVAIPPTAIPPVPIPPAIEVPVPVVPEGLFDRLKRGLGKTRGGLTEFLTHLALGRKAIDRDLLEDIEAQLLMADIGVTATAEIVADLTESLERNQLGDVGALTERLREHLCALLEPVSHPLKISADHKPFVILVVGVNGVGKTTTIGKLAKRLQNQGLSVMLAAGDTFRAAAVEQLQTWGERNNIPVIAQHTGADSASVIFDGLQSAQARNIDVLIADTAGRLHTKSNLMEELAKIKRIMAKLDPSAPHEVLLVLDAGTGQNAINQTRQFNEAVGVTGLVLTKLDGTAKGGIIFALAKQFGIPVRYIGVGESIDDLQDFDARRFIDALFTTG